MVLKQFAYLASGSPKLDAKLLLHGRENVVVEEGLALLMLNYNAHLLINTLCKLCLGPPFLCSCRLYGFGHSRINMPGHNLFWFLKD